MWQMCQMPNIWHICQTKHKKHLPTDVLYVPNFYHLCPYGCKFCNGMDTNGKLKNTILFDFSLSSHFFIWFSLSLLRIYLSLSPKFPTCVLPLLTIGRKQEKGGTEEGDGNGQSSSSSITTTSANHNHHLNNKTQIQKNPTPQQQNPNPSTKLKPKKLVVNPPLHRNPHPPLLQIKLSPQIHYLRPQPQTKTINHCRPTLCGDHCRPLPTTAETIANHRLQECRYGVRLSGDGF